MLCILSVWRDETKHNTGFVTTRLNEILTLLFRKNKMTQYTTGQKEFLLNRVTRHCRGIFDIFMTYCFHTHTLLNCITQEIKKKKIAVLQTIHIHKYILTKTCIHSMFKYLCIHVSVYVHM